MQRARAVQRAEAPRLAGLAGGAPAPQDPTTSWDALHAPHLEGPGRWLRGAACASTAHRQHRCLQRAIQQAHGAAGCRCTCPCAGGKWPSAVGSVKAGLMSSRGGVISGWMEAVRHLCRFCAGAGGRWAVRQLRRQAAASLEGGRSLGMRPCIPAFSNRGGRGSGPKHCWWSRVLVLRGSPPDKTIEYG